MHGENLCFFVVEATKSRKVVIEGKPPQHVLWKEFTALKDRAGEKVQL